MSQPCPITPPPELVGQWRHQWWSVDPDCENTDLQHYIATQAAQWGADQELGACYYWIENYHGTDAADSLQQGRRPKSPTLKEQAFRELGDIYNDEKIDGHAYNTIRQALEALPND